MIYYAMIKNTIDVLYNNFYIKILFYLKNKN